MASTTRWRSRLKLQRKSLWLENKSETVNRHRAVGISAIIAIRVAAAPLVVYTFVKDRTTWTIRIFVFAGLTDALDGYLVRRLGVSPLLGTYFDATADLLLVLAAFSAFVMEGIYPFWTLLLIGSMFIQFIVTSGLQRPLYDPVGKFYGVFLFVAAGVTLIFPRPVIYTAILVGIVGFTVASVASRSVFLLRKSVWR